VKDLCNVFRRLMWANESSRTAIPRGRTRRNVLAKQGRHLTERSRRPRAPTDNVSELYGALDDAPHEDGKEAIVKVGVPSTVLQEAGHSDRGVFSPSTWLSATLAEPAGLRLASFALEHQLHRLRDVPAPTAAAQLLRRTHEAHHLGTAVIPCSHGTIRSAWPEQIRAAR